MRDEGCQPQAGVVIVGRADAVAVVDLLQLGGRAVDDVGDDRSRRPTGDALKQVAGAVKVADLVVVRIGECGDAVEGVISKAGAVAHQIRNPK